MWIFKTKKERERTADRERAAWMQIEIDKINLDVLGGRIAALEDGYILLQERIKKLEAKDE